MLVDGLTAYVAELYRVRAGDRASWVLNTDARQGDYLQPVMSDSSLPPPWLQVRTCVGRLRRDGQVDCLRQAVERSLGVAGEHDQDRPASVSVAPLLEVTPVGRRRWQVSLPEDIDERLGPKAYACLEAEFAAVEGVTEAIMEDRDRALLRTRRGVAQADLEARLTRVVEGLAAR
jgi:hypothetical protein